MIYSPRWFWNNTSSLSTRNGLLLQVHILPHRHGTQPPGDSETTRARSSGDQILYGCNTSCWNRSSTFRGYVPFSWFVIRPLSSREGLWKKFWLQNSKLPTELINCISYWYDISVNHDLFKILSHNMHPCAVASGLPCKSTRFNRTFNISIITRKWHQSAECKMNSEKATHWNRRCSTPS